jgi:hypothetical protein
MSGETNESTTEVVTNDNATEESVAQETGVTQEELAALTAQLEKQSALIDKLRQHEQTSLSEAEKEKQKRKGVEGEIDQLKESFSKQINDIAIDSALEKELSLAKAMNVDVAKKLIDRSGIDVVNGRANTQKIAEIINNLKESESYLFKSETSETKKAAPKPVRAGEGEPEDIVKKEMKNAKTVQELQAVIAKYGVGTSA